MRDFLTYGLIGVMVGILYLIICVVFNFSSNSMNKGMGAILGISVILIIIGAIQSLNPK